jgi:poly(3-hydroxybutyrate) depolymerase
MSGFTVFGSCFRFRLKKPEIQKIRKNPTLIILLHGCRVGVRVQRTSKDLDYTVQNLMLD